MLGAAGEAAFMTGLERNSDIVFAASYAPLLQVGVESLYHSPLRINDSKHVNSTQWVCGWPFFGGVLALTVVLADP